jgi:signal transduction histidine kinase
MPERGRKSRLRKAREESARRGERIAEMERTHCRLARLQEISKLLTRFQSVERTVPEVVAVLAQTQDLHSAIFIMESMGRMQTLVWQSRGGSPERLQAAKDHAQRAFNYLVRSGIDLEQKEQAKTLKLPQQAETERVESKKNLVILPLVVNHGAIFGALQLEVAGTFDENDLVFVNVVVNQLAIAIDRQVIINARQAAMEASEREQRVLADVSALVGVSLQYRDTTAALARFVVPLLADVCVVDELAEDGGEHLDVVFADENKQRELAERVRRAASGCWQTRGAKVVAAGRPLLFSRITVPLAEGLAFDEEHADVLRAAGVTSMMAVPLLSRGKLLGMITFGAAESGRRYSTHDLTIAEEIARRTAIAIDNTQLYHQAERATQLREELLAVVSHDLKSPLSTILLNLTMLGRAPEDEFEKRLASMRRSAERMNRLVEDLLDMASIDAGHLSVEKQRLGAARLVAEAVEAMQLLATSKSLHLRSEAPSELPAVHADPTRLQQVFANLLGNAIKFTAEGGSIMVRAEASGDLVTFSVKDTGPGIAGEEMSHLFDRFWQVKRTARLGTGLGLFIVKGIVEAHGGSVWAESNVGQGSTFSFTIPVAPPSVDHAAEEEGS